MCTVSHLDEARTPICLQGLLCTSAASAWSWGTLSAILAPPGSSPKSGTGFLRIPSCAELPVPAEILDVPRPKNERRTDNGSCGGVPAAPALSPTGKHSVGGHAVWDGAQVPSRVRVQAVLDPAASCKPSHIGKYTLTSDEPSTSELRILSSSSTFASKSSCAYPVRGHPGAGIGIQVRRSDEVGPPGITAIRIEPDLDLAASAMRGRTD